MRSQTSPSPASFPANSGSRSTGNASGRPEEEDPSFASLPLDDRPAVLTRYGSTRPDPAELQRLAPRLKIATSHDKAATDALKKKSRNADVVVLATRCAKHAATGFITENAGKPSSPTPMAAAPHPCSARPPTACTRPQRNPKES